MSRPCGTISIVIQTKHNQQRLLKLFLVGGGLSTQFRLLFFFNEGMACRKRNWRVAYTFCCEANDSGVSTPAILLEVVGSSANCGTPSGRIIKFVGPRAFLAISIRNAVKYNPIHVLNKRIVVTILV